MASIEFPDKLQCLFQPFRYKVLYGGRGGAKSWGIARALLLIGASKPLRVLCAREFQKSITDSVHKLLKDQISEMGLEALYEVQTAKIIGRPGTAAAGTEFAFIGLKSNVHSIKSFEGVDVCWVEEAANVSQASWEFLIPTIRKEGSEIWLSFNPEDEEDFTYKEFVLKKRPNSVVQRITFRDNPWFPETLRAEMMNDKEKDPDRYLHVWEGHCKLRLDGAVFANEIRDLMGEDRLTWVPWERSLPVDTAWDLGRSDNTSIWVFQRVAMQIRVVDFIEGNRQSLQYYVKALQGLPYTLGTHWLPHDAKAKSIGSRLSVEEQLKAAFGPGRVKVLKAARIADGLAAARAMFPNVVIDATHCRVGFEHLKKYSYDLIPGRNVFSNNPRHDEHSHAADAWRYMAFAASYGSISEASQARAETTKASLSRAKDLIKTGLGWMA